jgi:hypothetical protein
VELFSHVGYAGRFRIKRFGSTSSIWRQSSHDPLITQQSIASTMQNESKDAAQYSYQRAKVRVAEDKEGFPSFWNFDGQPIHVSYDPIHYAQ